MSDSEIEKRDEFSLHITYRQFFAVLRKWDFYIWPEVQTMSRGISTMRVATAEQYGVPLGFASAEKMRVSELGKALWKSLLAGADEVDRIHDEIFVNAQVEYFKETYSSPEEVADGLEDYYRLDPPTETFTKLGKPAQMVIVRDGLLQQAIEVYKQAKEINRRKEQAEIEAKEQRLREARERRASPDYVRPIGQDTRKRVRALDKNQCVFCGAETHGRNRYVRLTPTGYKAEDVVLACMPCDTTLKNKTPDQANMKPKFGRFSS
ncbi:MAG: hypothetical protein M3362_02380 [Acidobacteriota bacterium]|nr:hypothetical protein [Acidobacteriota bacterium]